MKTNVERLQDDQLKLVITAEQPEVDKLIDKTYKDFANRYKFPGFRKGKAPRPVIDNVLGAEAVLATVTDEITNTFFPLAMDAENLCPIDDPKFDENEALVESGKDFVFSLTMTMAPEVELTSYEPVEIKLLDENPTEADIDDRIEALTMYYYDTEDAPADQVVGESGLAVVSLDVTTGDGDPVNVLCSNERNFELGMGLYPASLDDAIAEMKAGEQKTVSVNIAQENSILMRALDGNPEVLNFDVTVHAVKVKVFPEVTEEFAEKAGFKSIEDMRNRTRENLVRERQEYLPQMKENACLYQLIERYPVEVPEILQITERRDLLTGFYQQLNQQEVTFDQYLKQRGLTADQFQEDLKRQANDVAKQNLAVDAYAKHFGFTVSDEEIEAEFERSGMEDIEAVKKQFREEGRIRILRRNIVRSNAIDDIMAKAIVTVCDSDEWRAYNEAHADAADKAYEEAQAEAEAPVVEEKPAKKPTKKQALQAKATELGLSFTQKNTIAELEAMIAEAEAK